MTFNPYQVWYGQEGKMYATITCLMLLATYFWLRGITAGESGRGWDTGWQSQLPCIPICLWCS